MHHDVYTQDNTQEDSRTPLDDTEHRYEEHGLSREVTQSSLSVEYCQQNPSLLVGRQLADARKKAQLTQMNLAARTGIDQAVISRIERGKGNPTVSILQTLGQPLGLRIAFIPYEQLDPNEDTA